MATTQRAADRSLPVGWWCVGLGAIAVAVGVAIWLLHLTTYDLHQQLPLVRALASGDLVHALEGVAPRQTSGPGFGLFALPVFLAARPFASDQTAYLVASFACLIPLAVATVAAARATGVVRRSVRELVTLAVVMLGIPILANYLEALHPADVLATACCLGAFAAVQKRRVPWAFVLLGFALATRQWAVLAVAVLAVLERGDERRHLVLGSVGVAVVLVLPFFLANAGQTILVMQAERTSRGFLAAPSLFDLPESVAYGLSRYVPLVGTAVLCAWLLRRRVTWSPEVGAAALAVAFLIRPPFDPAGFLYYAAPGYAFFVLLDSRSWRWLVTGTAGSAALLLRFTVRDRFPYAEVVTVYGPEGSYLAPGVTLSVLTTLVLLAALVAAILHLRTVVDREKTATVLAPGLDPLGR